MPEVGVRELKTHASEIIRQVRENRARYIITYRGQPVGLLTPLEEPAVSEVDLADGDAVWEELTRLGEEISRGRRSPLSVTEILSEMRDERDEALKIP